MKKIFVFSAVLFSLVLCGEVPQKPGFKILDDMHKKSAGENIIFSPFSIQECFGMISCGAGEHSSRELSTVLGLDAYGCQELRKARKSFAEIGNARISSCNTLLFDSKLTLYKDFAGKAVHFYNGRIFKADFSRPDECADLINEVVKKQSSGMFEKIVNAEDFRNSPLAVLMNVLYFQAQWRDPFESAATQKQVFHVSEKEKYQVDMMLDTRYVPYYNDGKIHAVFLRYINPRFQMAFLMPVDPATPLTAVTGKLADEGINGIAEKASSSNETVIQIPKLDISVENDLVAVLRNSGMKYVFDMINGDLDKMVVGIPVFIDRAKQFVKLKLDENGTEMAAVTIAMPKACSAAPGEKIINNFHADRPYVIVLYDTETSAILLNGVIYKPVNVHSAEQK